MKPVKDTKQAAPETQHSYEAQGCYQVAAALLRIKAYSSTNHMRMAQTLKNPQYKQ